MDPKISPLSREDLPFANYCKIDNTDLPPETVAEMIRSHFAIEKA